jgi:hypothetical protein
MLFNGMREHKVWGFCVYPRNVRGSSSLSFESSTRPGETALSQGETALSFPVCWTCIVVPKSWLARTRMGGDDLFSDLLPSKAPGGAAVTSNGEGNLYGDSVLPEALAPAPSLAPFSSSPSGSQQPMRKQAVDNSPKIEELLRRFTQTLEDVNRRGPGTCAGGVGGPLSLSPLD